MRSVKLAMAPSSGSVPCEGNAAGPGIQCADGTTGAMARLTEYTSHADAHRHFSSAALWELVREHRRDKGPLDVTALLGNRAPQRRGVSTASTAPRRSYSPVRSPSVRMSGSK